MFGKQVQPERGENSSALAAVAVALGLDATGKTCTTPASTTGNNKAAGAPLRHEAGHEGASTASHPAAHPSPPTPSLLTYTDQGLPRDAPRGKQLAAPSAPLHNSLGGIRSPSEAAPGATSVVWVGSSSGSSSAGSDRNPGTEAAPFATIAHASAPKSPLATDNLLENTDGVLRPPSLGVLSGRQPATF